MPPPPGFILPADTSRTAAAGQQDAAPASALAEQRPCATTTVRHLQPQPEARQLRGQPEASTARASLEMMPSALFLHLLPFSLPIRARGASQLYLPGNTGRSFARACSPRAESTVHSA